MAVNDPLGDMLTRIRNAQMRRRSKVSTPGSSLRSKVLDVLQAEGYIRGYSVTDYGNGRTEFEIELKYFDNQPVIRKIDRVSKPGRRVYVAVDRHAARRQRPRRFDPVDAQGRDGGSRRSRGACRRRSALHRVLTVTNGKLSPCLVSERSPSSSPPASPPRWRARSSPSKAPRAN